MCGILLNIYRDGNDKFSEKLKELICNRGPNACNEFEAVLANNWKCHVLGSVLWTQGDSVIVQPLRNHDGSFLLWNGDVFSGLIIPKGCNDTEIIFDELINFGLTTYTKICGPYAFIYYNAKNNSIWLGRDVLGRHSLLWSTSSDNLLFASAGTRDLEIEEIPSYGIFKIDLSKPILEIELHPWTFFDKKCLKITYPFTLSSKLTHPYFTSPLKYDWYNREPHPQEIEFLEEFSPTMEADYIFTQLALNPTLKNIVTEIKRLLIQSVKRRIETKPDYCNNCISTKSFCSHSKLAILFSGGLDSTVLALIASNLLPINEPIDLYNVAFNKNKRNGNEFLVPDRKNGLESLKELTNLFPNRKWNFVEINIKGDELQELRSNHIADLIYPLTSILDDSLGCALWFAARGKGVVNSKKYTSPARVVLLGMGADEIFGGYSRHKKIFEKNMWSGLGLQLVEEVSNIGKRNLGRDNRVVNDHGRQARMPYLDEEFIKFSSSLPPWHRCCLSKLPNGVGDKMILRCLSREFGLRYCSILPKKALQFGSKIANSKEKGHELCNRLLSS